MPSTTPSIQSWPRTKARPERRFLDDVYGLLDGVRLGYGAAVLPLHLVREERDLEVVDADKVLLMVEVRAERGGRRLHNFAGHLLRIDGGRIAEWWMVDAKPAESDEFWSS